MEEGKSERTRSSSLREGKIPALFIMISAGRDDETSAAISTVDKDFSLPLVPAGSTGGVFTSAILQVLQESSQKNEENRIQASWMEVMERLRAIVKEKGFSNQVPQLSSSIELNVEEPFTIVPENCSVLATFSRKKRRRRAILIGINYVGHPEHQLTACHNDVLNVQRYLITHQGFDIQDMAVMMDDGKHALPTKANIEMAFELMTMQSDPGDVVFIYYSGHGRQYEDLDGDEIDGMDEAILPCDFETAGPIIDDDIYRQFVLPMREGVHVVSLMDSCHSGTGMDLPYEITVGETSFRRSTKLNLENLDIQDLDDESSYTPRQKIMRQHSERPFRDSFSSVQPLYPEEE
eukprot:scaffold13706_cov98-Cylindrotheca_fusiformis.AAC.1